MSKKKRGAFGKKALQKQASRGKSPPGRHSRKRETCIDRSDANTDSIMQEVARNTNNKSAHWDQGSRLRDRPVIFISGGFVEPPQELESKIASKLDVISTTQPAMEIESGKASHAYPPSSPMPNLPTPAFMPPTGEVSNAHQNALDDNSDSNEEVILFKGRGSYRRNRLKVHNKTHPPDTPHDDDHQSDAALDDYVANMLNNEMQDSIENSDTNDRNLGEHSDNTIIEESGTASTERVLGVRLDANDSESEQSKPGYQAEQIEEEGDEDDEDGYGVNIPGRMSTSVDDEQLARILGKQEELGLGGDDLLLFDADSADTLPGKRALRSAKRFPSKGSKPPSLKAAATGQYNLTITRDGSFPSAEAVADAFEQLDMAGWDRDGDGTRLELSDSELEATLMASWLKDRLRKKEKKQAREALRAQGLLGKNVDTDDPRVKYPNGMNLDDMKKEFHEFLIGSASCTTFPPMDASARKIIHELSHRFNITSKSTGSGDQRRPTIARTKSTVKYNEVQFESIFARIQRRYFPRLDGPSRSKRAARDSGRRGGNDAAAVVRHGEVVGGSAPEIGETNKGREMLEKMGWSMGMALGAVDNQGMTQPIEHIVKRSKAGLG